MATALGEPCHHRVYVGFVEGQDIGMEKLRWRAAVGHLPAPAIEPLGAPPDAMIRVVER
ncbi:MAG TPA: hypothetical protein VN808_18235 [Stellaceae bacterium]|nr:hypothetical protein [Stellaceae bacterium]